MLFATTFGTQMSRNPWCRRWRRDQPFVRLTPPLGHPRAPQGLHKTTQKKNSKIIAKSTSKWTPLSSQSAPKVLKKRSKIQLGFRIAPRLVLWCSGGGSKLKNVCFTYGKHMFLKSHSFALGTLLGSKMGPFWLQKATQSPSQIDPKTLSKMWSEFGSKMEPKWTQNEPQRRQKSIKKRYDFYKNHKKTL